MQKMGKEEREEGKIEAVLQILRRQEPLTVKQVGGNFDPNVSYLLPCWDFFSLLMNTQLNSFLCTESYLIVLAVIEAKYQ